MTIEGNTEADNIEQQHYELSVPFDDMDQMFYHRFRTSNELCSAGLFTLDPHNTSKKHRRMKCNFCNSVMCGWKDKFCKHLDRCQRAQEYFASHPINTELEVIQRKNKRAAQALNFLLGDPKRVRQDSILSFDNEDYLNMLAAGFVCSSTVTRNIFDNDFLKNLCFTLHWQAPSLYVIQKKITEVSSRLSDAALRYLSQQSAITLIVYPWVDINKRSSLTFVACTSTNMIVFLTHISSKSDNWNHIFIVEQCRQVIDTLHQHNVMVSLFYFDGCSMFDQFRDIVTMSPQISYIPVIGNSMEWCHDLLNTIFSFPSLIGMKQSVLTVYTSFQKNSSLFDLFKDQCVKLYQREVKLSPVSDEQWWSIFACFDCVISCFQAFVGAHQSGISSGLITNQHPLYTAILDAAWLDSLTAITNLFREIALCTSSQSADHLNIYNVYHTLLSCLSDVKSCSLGTDLITHCTNTITLYINRFFDHDFMCLLHYLVQQKQPSQDKITFDESNFPHSAAAKELEKLLQTNNGGNQAIEEFDSFCRSEDPLFGTISPLEYWTSVGKLQYPALSSVASVLLSYPATQQTVEQWTNMKSIIHFHVRNRKETEVTSRINDEMMISCNRHLLIRWDLDFQ